MKTKIDPQIVSDFHSWCFQGHLFDFVRDGELNSRWRVLATVGQTAKSGAMIKAAVVKLPTDDKIYFYTECGSWRFVDSEPFTTARIAELKALANSRTNQLIKKVCEFTK